MARHGRPMPGADRWRFEDRAPEDYPRPTLNPYLKLHREYGPPVIVGEDAPGFKGRWAEAFGGRQAPLHVEIGSGNGFFLAGMAQRHPDWNWLGIELRFKRVVLCAKKIDRLSLSNARIARYDAFFLDDLFEEASVAGIYVNHPDPWPKGRQEKHRLIAPAFVDWAASALQDEGVLRLKTDFHPHIERLEQCAMGQPIELDGRSCDVNGEGAPWPDDVATNYQRKFAERNEPVYALGYRRLRR